MKNNKLQAVLKKITIGEFARLAKNCASREELVKKFAGKYNLPEEEVEKFITQNIKHSR